MTVLTGSDTFFTNIDSTFTATKWEVCIEQAIDKINDYARDVILPQMTGTAGSKSVSLALGAGFVRELAVAIYQKDVKSAGAQSRSIGIGGFTSAQSASSGSGAEIEELAMQAALHLKEMEVSYG